MSDDFLINKELLFYYCTSTFSINDRSEQISFALYAVWALCQKYFFKKTPRLKTAILQSQIKANMEMINARLSYSRLYRTRQLFKLFHIHQSHGLKTSTSQIKHRPTPLFYPAHQYIDTCPGPTSLFFVKGRKKTYENVIACFLLEKSTD